MQGNNLILMQLDIAHPTMWTQDTHAVGTATAERTNAGWRRGSRATTAFPTTIGGIGKQEQARGRYIMAGEGGGCMQHLTAVRRDPGVVHPPLNATSLCAGQE